MDSVREEERAGVAGRVAAGVELIVVGNCDKILKITARMNCKLYKKSIRRRKKLSELLSRKWLIWKVVNNPQRSAGMNELEKSMLSLLLVGKDVASLANFSAELSKNEELRVIRAVSGKEAWTILGSCKIDVVVIDEDLADGDALSFVRELTRKQPQINCAMVSHLSPEDFHETTEGLGVFMQLPVAPGAEEAGKMMRLLKSINVLMSNVA